MFVVQSFSTNLALARPLEISVCPQKKDYDSTIELKLVPPRCQCPTQRTRSPLCIHATTLNLLLPQVCINLLFSHIAVLHDKKLLPFLR
jgi:hypothetical protein